MNHETRQTERIARRWQLTANPCALKEYIDQFLDTDLCHHIPAQTPIALPPELEAIYTHLHSVAQDRAKLSELPPVTPTISTRLSPPPLRHTLKRRFKQLWISRRHGTQPENLGLTTH